MARALLKKLLPLAAAGLALLADPAAAQILPSPNVNMVSGTQWPDGDPFLQRQNESSMAVSTRNALHLLAGANDYRTVDLPGLPEDRVVGDAWLGVFKSLDGGSTWRSTLLPGYPQDNSPQGLASPLKGFQAAADPTVRAGTNGLFYYSGIVLDRQERGRGAVFVARFIDNNNKESGDPIVYLDTRVIDLGNAGQFVDKPWLFVDLPRPGAATCSVAGQTFAAGNVYLTYSVSVGSKNNLRTNILFARSTDCGATWSRPVKISEGFPLSQGSSLTVDPASGAVYVFWRQFKTHQAGDAIVMARSTDGGRKFTKPAEILIAPFDQGTSIISFRTSAQPAAAVDDAGRVYLAWAQRNVGPGGDARIVISVSTNGGATWSVPTPVDAARACAAPNPDCRGHQIMPSLAFAGGRLVLVYYDLRLDHTVGRLNPVANPPPAFEETRDPAGNLPANPEVVYTSQIMDAAPAGSSTPLLRRLTIDVFAAQATPAAAPVWETPVRVSQYVFGNPRLPGGGAPGEIPIRQLQFNPPNLPVFRLGTAAFFSDYVDVAVSRFRVVPGTRQWVHTDGSEAPVYHATWTDNRDVRPPPDGNWANYVPVGSAGGPSLFDPGQQRPACQPDVDGRRTGMRNQNVYTARLTQGLLAGSPGNSKPLGQTRFPDNSVGLYQRAFVAFAQNATDEMKHYRFTIADQPAGGQASFLQFGPLTELEATIAPRSSITRTIFVTSTDPDATVTVLVREIDAIGGGLVPPDQGGLQSTVTLNGDPTNPDVTNPDVTNPDVTNPDVTNAEVYNPDVTNPDVTNPDVTNPDVTNPDVTNPDVTNVNVYNPDVTNPDVTNPDVTNPDVTNPDVTNPDVTNSDIQNGSVTDATWTATNDGNTAAGYSVKLLLNGDPPPNGFKLQLILHKPYTTPVALGCELKVQTQNVLIGSIPRPEFADPGDIGTPDPTNPDVTNATLFLAPGESARITLRVVDPVANDAITWDPTTRVTPAVEAQAVNTEDALEGGIRPPVALPITITTDSLPAGPSYTPYLQGLTATGGEGAYTWSIREGGLAPGLTLDPATGSSRARRSPPAPSPSGLPCGIRPCPPTPTPRC